MSARIVRFMLVEDQPNLTRVMVAILRAERLRVCSTARVAGALELLEAGGVDAAILDINVEDGLVYPVADALRAQGIPFGFCSSMDADEVPARHRMVPFLHKPFEMECLLDLVGQLEARTNGHQAGGHEGGGHEEDGLEEGGRDGEHRSDGHGR